MSRTLHSMFSRVGASGALVLLTLFVAMSQPVRTSSGAAMIPAAEQAATSVTFQVLNTCNGGTLNFSVNGIAAGSTSAGGDCTCQPAMRTFTTTNAAILSALSDSCAAFTATMNTSQTSTYLSWVKATVNRAGGGSQSLCVYDYGGGNCDVADLCNAGYNASASGQTFSSTGGPLDSDGDGQGDACGDPDNDNDGVLNAADNCPVNANPTQTDTDGNGQGDACDAFDRDKDGVWNASDNCPDKRNADQNDADNDGIGDVCDPTSGDSDGDGIANAADNCPTASNADQRDADNDGVGDRCDATSGDTDFDGIPNGSDNCPSVANTNQIDTDANGVGNACSPAVVAVPWLGTESLGHPVYSGGSVILQAAAYDGNGNPLVLTAASWNPGDGSPVVNIPFANGRILERVHTYTGADNQPFTATITVTATGGQVYTDTMRVVIRPNNRETRVNMAIDKGLWNLHKGMQTTTSDGLPSGNWVGSGYNVATTAGALQAFQINNHRETADWFVDPYVHNVRRGMRYVLSAQHGFLQSLAMTLQNGNDPDGNNNGIGLQVNYSGHQSYLGGQLMDAIVTSGSPDRIADVGQAGSVKGRTYRQILQDLLDGYSWGMADNTGGWYYGYQDITGSNDTSASHWWAIGVLAAETWGMDAPEWVKNIQREIGIPLMQNATTGVFGYTNNQSPLWDDGTNTTAAGLILMNADDMSKTHARFGAASTYLNNRFVTSTGNYYTMFQTAKAMRTALDANGVSSPIELLNGTRDWYAAYADHLVGNQNAAGAFTQTVGTPSINGDMTTSWAIIILSPSLFSLPPTAVCSASPSTLGTNGGLVQFTAAGSSHPDPNATIVSYSWDFGDGSTSGTGVTTSHTYARPASFPTTHAARVTVTDSNGVSNTSACAVTIVNTNVPPNPVAGGPYEACIGSPVILNGSASADEDGTIAAYAWSWGAVINFSAPNATTATVDATAAFTALGPGLHNVGLQVKDNDGATGSQFTTVLIRAANDASCNQPPTAVNDAASTFSGTPVTVAVLANDTDPNAGQALSVTGIPSGPINGAAVVNANGTVTYTPTLGFAGVETFTYSIGDGQGGTASATVTVTVTKRTASVTAGSGTKVYGSADPSLTATSAGFQAADNIAVTMAARDAGENVGTYATHATAAGAKLANYSVTYNNGTLDITKATATATATGGTFTYDGQAHGGTCSVAGVNGEVLNGTISYAPGSGAPIAAGSYTVTCDFAGTNNYVATNATATITITKAAATVTAGSGTKVFGSADPTLTATSAGFVGADNIVVTQTARDAGENVGTYATHATATGAALTNYAVSYTDGSLEITKAVATATATGGTFTYDGQAHGGTCSVAGVNGEVLNGTISYAPGSGAPTAAGSYTVTCDFAGTNNYLATNATATITITKAAATVTAGSGTKVFGSADPTLTATSTGFVGADGIVVTQTARDAGENVGTYATHATAAGAALDNYTVSYTDGSLEIAKATAVATATGGTFTYDGQAHGGTCSVAGVNGEVLNGTISYAPGSGAPSAAGSYTVTCDFAGTINYLATNATATITITKAAATVTAGSGTKVFGAADPTLTATSTGFVGADGIVVTQTARDAGETVGAYATHATAAGAALDNYAVTYTDGSLEITKAVATATATGGTFTYNGQAHGGTCSVAGVNGEVLAGIISYSSGGEPVAAGSYTVVCDFAGTNNYVATNASATITITKAAATVTAGSGTKVFGSADPTLTATSAGFVGADNIVVSQTARDAGENVGTYATHATATGAALGNYTVTYTDGAFEITKATAVATATGATVTYDGQAHGGTCSVAGVNGAVLSGSISYSTTGGGEPVAAGSYTVTCDFAETSNYNGTTATATIVINKAAATVTAGSGSKVYGTADPALTATSAGFVGADAIVVTQTARDAGEAAGTYATHAIATGATLDNYAVTYVDGALDISKATATATATGGTFIYDGQPHGGTCAVAPVTGSDVLTGTVSYSSGTEPVAVGSYTVTCTFAGTSNYNATSGTATIVITQGATTTTITAPTVTYMANGLVTVAVSSASGVVPGAVSLTVDGSTTLTATLSGGSATFVLPSPNAGNHALVATYLPQGNFSGSSATGTLQVNPSPTSTTLATSATPQLAGTPVTFTATVTSVAPGSGTPNGVVTFKEGATVLGTGTLNASGVATFTTTTLSNGPHTITAVYNGVNNYLTSTSTTVSKLIFGLAAGGGTFVIGDNNAALNSQVMFWGAQWEKNNSMTGGSSNNSFKGYAIAPGVPAVGQTFTAAPGNSAPSPSGVPQYIGIIVTSKVTKAGSTISGTIVKLVVVQVDPGYQGNPGHAGTGKVVAFVQ